MALPRGGGGKASQMRVYRQQESRGEKAVCVRCLSTQFSNDCVFLPTQRLLRDSSLSPTRLISLAHPTTSPDSPPPP